MKILANIIGTFMNIAVVMSIGFFATGIWPAKADTTGVLPEYEVLDSDAYLMDTVLEGPYDKYDLQCLVENMYFEARNDGYAGMYATTMVVMNRVSDPRYPDTVCGVVHQGPVKESWKTKQTPDKNDAVYFPIRNKCQFSWYCDGKADIMYNEDAVYLATDIAKLVLDISTGVFGDKTFTVDITEGATHYHATYVNPYWTNDRGMAKITQIGTHIFYRWGE